MSCFLKVLAFLFDVYLQLDIFSLYTPLFVINILARFLNVISSFNIILVIIDLIAVEIKDCSRFGAKKLVAQAPGGIKTIKYNKNLKCYKKKKFCG